jgi:hypothetical protein
MYRWLKSHPDVFFPAIKEPSFFVNYYGIKNWDQYESLFKAGEGKKIIGEASTAYLSSPESPDWIRKILGSDIKILILVRNPVERAFSLYKWMIMEGYEVAYPFEKALELEEERFADESFRIHNPEFFWDYMYVRSSIYCASIEKYINVFGRDAIKIDLFDDLIANPSDVYNSVCSFLGISNDFRPQFTPENKSITPLSVKLQGLLRANAYRITAEPLIGRMWTAGVCKLMRLNKWFGLEMHLRRSTRSQLANIFEEDVGRLASLLGRDLSHWAGTGVSLREVDVQKRAWIKSVG